MPDYWSAVDKSPERVRRWVSGELEIFAEDLARENVTVGTPEHAESFDLAVDTLASLLQLKVAYFHLEGEDLMPEIFTSLSTAYGEGRDWMELVPAHAYHAGVDVPGMANLDRGDAEAMAFGLLSAIPRG